MIINLTDDWNIWILFYIELPVIVLVDNFLCYKHIYVSLI